MAQAPLSIEILVVDNCSTDNTWAILETFHDPRLRILRNESNIGLIGNFNRCLALAKGTYVKFLCSDDILTPFCLKHEVEVMETNPNVVLLSTRGRLIDCNGKLISIFANHFPPGIYPGRPSIFSWLWVQSHYGYNPLNYHPGILLRSKIAKEVGGFDISMKVGGDIDLFLSMLEKGDLAVLDTIDCDIRVHPDQESNCLKENGGLMEDLFALNLRYSKLLSELNSFNRVMQQTAAISAGMALKHFILGRRSAGKLHWKIAHYLRVSNVKIFIALMRLIALRFLLSVTGIRITRLPPPLPIKPD